VATNRSLSELVKLGRFRLDLYYRLGGVEIHVPPLRVRRDDILELANHFLDRYRSVRPLRLSAAAADALQTYHWPGNVRELERVIERAVTLGESDEIGVDDLPPAVSSDYAGTLLPSLLRADTMRAWSSRYARLVLERCGRNKRKACRELNISYHTLKAYLSYRPERDYVRKPRARKKVAKTTSDANSTAEPETPEAPSQDI
jgi:DNA-binding NtrC family response regulator